MVPELVTTFDPDLLRVPLRLVPRDHPAAPDPPPRVVPSQRSLHPVLRHYSSPLFRPDHLRFCLSTLR